MAGLPLHPKPVPWGKRSGRDAGKAKGQVLLCPSFPGREGAGRKDAADFVH